MEIDIIWLDLHELQINIKTISYSREKVYQRVNDMKKLSDKKWIRATNISEEERGKRKKRILYKPLCRNVLTVAVVNVAVRDFTVYIGSTKGKSYQKIFLEVAQSGCKLNKKIAKILYPTLFKNYHWRE